MSKKFFTKMDILMIIIGIVFSLAVAYGVFYLALRIIKLLEVKL